MNYQNLKSKYLFIYGYGNSVLFEINPLYFWSVGNHGQKSEGIENCGNYYSPLAWGAVVIQGYPRAIPYIDYSIPTRTE